MDTSEIRILVASIPTRRNRFLGDLNAALARVSRLTHSSDDFWSMRGDYDIVHMHWPEYMTYEIETAYNTRLSPALVDEIRTRLHFWSRTAQIVVTRHNPAPYNAPEDPHWRRVYELVFAHASGVVHMGNASVDDFRRRYDGLLRNRNSAIEHAIVPIQNYAALPNDVSRDQARNRLNISSDAQVMLVFGAIRTDAERALVLDTFTELPIPAKVLVASNWREAGGSQSLSRSSRIARSALRAARRFRRDIRFNYGYVEDSLAQHYLNSADVLFIPRLWLLNSANVSLGFTFGLVTVGPDAGNAGEILRERGNPVFDPKRPDSAVAAVAKAFTLAREGSLGANNRGFALSEWAVEKCAASYVAFFRKVIAAA